MVDDAGTSASRLLISRAQATSLIDVRHRFESVTDLEVAMARGEVSVGLYIPADFESRLVTSDRPLAQLFVDGSDPVVHSAVRGLQQLPAAEFGQGVPGFEMRVLCNPERRSPVFIVPGLCGVILNLTMVLFTAVALERERERGNLELLISAIATNQFQAFQMTFMTFLPQRLLSGFMFPFEGMPEPARWLAELFPLTHFLRIVRGVVLREASLADLWPEVWPLLLFLFVFLVLATLRFSKRLD